MLLLHFASSHAWSLITRNPLDIYHLQFHVNKSMPCVVHGIIDSIKPGTHLIFLDVMDDETIWLTLSLTIGSWSPCWIKLASRRHWQGKNTSSTRGLLPIPQFPIKLTNVSCGKPNGIMDLLPSKDLNCFALKLKK